MNDARLENLLTMLELLLKLGLALVVLLLFCAGAWLMRFLDHPPKKQAPRLTKIAP